MCVCGSERDRERVSERWPFAGDDVSFSTSYMRMNVKKCRVFFVPLPLLLL